MTKELPPLQVRSRREWRAWLAKHHTSSAGVWLVFYKSHTGVTSISYEDTVREALCFGWIDSLVKRLDVDRYARRVTPRQPTSKWSDINRKRWAELKAAGLLTSAGLAATHERHLCATTGGTRPTGLHRQGAEGTCQSMGVLSGAGAHPPA